jgi:hypothetical protein
MDTAALEKLIEPLGSLPNGTVVVVNAETGATVVAATQAAALDAFEAEYGWGVPAHVHVVGSTRCAIG